MEEGRPFCHGGAVSDHHRFRNDPLDQRYGSEWDLLASGRRGHTALSVRYARYRPDTFATATDKLWLEADWIL